MPTSPAVRGIINPVARNRSIRADLVAAIDESATAVGFRLNDAQLVVRDRLLGLGDDLLASRWRRSKTQSLYVWGDAGRGKSWLLDAYFRALPIEAKRRVHFHGFFDQLHRRIHEHQGEASAVESAVRELTDGVRLLYFDEFHVHDSGDAALLTRLLRKLFETNVVLLASSNYAPTSLLPNPIWHHLFEPGIELILNNMDIIKLEGMEDYRGRPQSSVTGFRSGRWIGASPNVQQDCHNPQDPKASEAVELKVGSRQFPVAAQRGTELWITFEQLCGAQTSSVEYLRWAQQFDHWVLLDLPSFADTDPEAQQRLINVIDVLCDADVRTTITSSLTLEEFRATTQSRPDAFRMMSRLQLLQGVNIRSPLEDCVRVWADRHGVPPEHTDVLALAPASGCVREPVPDHGGDRGGHHRDRGIEGQAAAGGGLQGPG
ncbi:cell division protein ZapE [Arthrobacter sp. UYCu712]